MTQAQQLIWFGIFMSGLVYAFIVTGYWKSINLPDILIKVSIGVGGTLIWITTLFYFDPSPSFIDCCIYTWGPFAVTGFPMIAFQYYHYREQERMAQFLEDHDITTINDMGQQLAALKKGKSNG